MRRGALWKNRSRSVRKDGTRLQGRARRSIARLSETARSSIACRSRSRGRSETSFEGEGVPEQRRDACFGIKCTETVKREKYLLCSEKKRIIIGLIKHRGGRPPRIWLNASQQEEMTMWAVYIILFLLLLLLL